MQRKDVPITVRVFKQEKAGEKLEYFIAMQRKADVEIYLTTPGKQFPDGCRGTIRKQILCAQRNWFPIRTPEEAKRIILEMKAQTDLPQNISGVDKGISTFHSTLPVADEEDADPTNPIAPFRCRFLPPEVLDIALLPAREIIELSERYAKWTRVQSDKQKGDVTFPIYPAFNKHDVTVVTLPTLDALSLDTLPMLQNSASLSKSPSTLFKAPEPAASQPVYQREEICGELKRISERKLTDPQWKYNKAEKTAYIEYHDDEALKEVNRYLKKNEIKTRKGRNENTQVPLLYVLEPQVEVLRKINCLNPERAATSVLQGP